MPKKPLTLAPTKVPQLPAIPSDASASTKVWMAAMKEALEIRLGRVGDQRDRAITLRELISSGLAKDLSVRPYDPNNVDDFTWFVDPPDLTIPPKPTNFSASGAFTRIILSWTEGWTVFMNFSHTEIYRHTSNSLGDAVVINITQAGVYTDTVDYNATRYYWVRHVSTSGVKGPFSDEAHATTLIDIGAVMGALTESLADLPGYSTLTGLITDGPLVIRSASSPSTRADNSALRVNDIWLDTDDDQIYVRNAANNAWVKARDGAIKTDIDSLVASLNSSNGRSDTTLTAAIAQERLVRIDVENAKATSTELGSVEAKVDIKATTFIHGSASNLPTATAVGDILIRTDEGNKMYRATAANNSSWVAVRDTTNDGKATIFTQTGVPTSGVKAGDLWFDTNDENKQYRADADGANEIASGEWELVIDVTTSASVTTVSNAVVDGTSARAGYGVSVNADGAIAGMYIMANSSGALQNNNASSQIIFEADQFAIRSSSAGDTNADGGSSNKYTPFVVQTGATTLGGQTVPAGVYIDQGWIKNGAIDTATIATAAIETAKIDDLAVTSLKVATSAITEEKIFDLTVTGAKIRNATITNLHVREGAFEKAKINSLYAHSISGDVSKSVAGGLASPITFSNRLAAVSTYGWFDVLSLSLPKPTHPDGWAPYANFNINRVETDKNSWYHVMLEMAAWNVNSTGGTAVEQPNDLVGDNDGICASQSPSGAGNLTINGALHSSGTVTLTTPRAVTITKDNAADIGIGFVITGTNSSDQAQTEAITTMESQSTAAEGAKLFKTITQVAVDAAMTGNVVVGISNLISVHGAGYTAGTIYHDYLQFTPTYSLSNSTLTIASSVFIQNTNSEAGGTTALTPDLIASNSHYVSDGTTRRQIENWTLLNSNYIFNYTDSDSAPVSGWSGSQALYFSAAITAGSTGPYVRKSLIDWIAVDSAYNDFTIAGVWSNTAASANVTHGVKAKLSYRSNHDGSWEQDVDTGMVLHEATGFLMGVR